MPSITPATDFKVLGWAKEAKAIKAIVKVGEQYKINSDTNFYAITASPKGCIVTFKNNNTESLSYTKKIYYRYNGSEYCTITDIPYIYRNGYEIRGFSKLDGGIENLLNKKIIGNATYYAWAENKYRKKTLSLVTNYKIGKVAVEVEDNPFLYYNVYNNYESWLNGIYKNMPCLFHFKGKINMISKETYENIWSSWSKNSSGVTYGGYEISNIDISISKQKAVSLYKYGTFVHELGHAWDFYYGSKTGTRISDRSDIKTLYKYYKNQKSGQRPLRDYSYTNEKEFVADLVSFYYWDEYTYYDVRKIYKSQKGLDINELLKNTIEKYIKYANDGYVKK